MKPDIEKMAYSTTMHHTSAFVPPQAGAGDSIGAVPNLLRIHPVDSGIGLRSIDSTSVVLGRDESCEIVVADHSASRRHARIIQKKGKYFVADMGSTNGTWVNEDRIQVHQLKSGDCIRVGRWIFKFLHEDDIEARYHDSVYEMMTRDSLTGAWNKRYLLDVLTREISQHERSKQPIGLLMIDFDFFKQVNDDLGHMVGDEVLSQFGGRVRAAMRGGEVFARFGGDEFAIVFLNTDFESAMQAAERFRGAVASKKFLTSRGTLDCSISGGVAVWDPENPVSRDELLKAADDKLLEAKESARNCIVG